MLEKLTIREFQCHEQLTIRLDPAITTVCGRSDSGKSAILRSLRWLCTNRPSGTAFIRNGTGNASTNCRVHLSVDGHTIKRSRGTGGINLFQLDNKQFHAFGSDVPDEIEKLLNVSEENFQSQHSPAFWFGLSPGEVSKRLNQIVNLDLIDKTLANLASESRKAKVTVEVAESRLQAAREKRKGLAWVEDADEALTQVEKAKELYEVIREKRLVVASSIEKLSDIESNRDRLLGAGLAIARVLEAGDRAVEIKNEIKVLAKLIDSLLDATETADACSMEAMEIEDGIKTEIGTECPLCLQAISKQ